MLTDLIIKILFRKEVHDMAVVYATLIIKDKKKFSEVPKTLQEQVRGILIDLDLSELAQ